MTATIITNNRATRDAFVPPPTINEEGVPTQWRMFYEGGSHIADADALEDLIEVLIPGYATLISAANRTFARTTYMQEVRGNLRARILAGIPTEEWDALSEGEKSALEWDGEFDPDFRDTDGAPFVWKSDIPLVLLEADYAPYEPLKTAPLSKYGDHEVVDNILWLRSSTEQAFLVTLSYSGVIDFGTPRAVNRKPVELRS